MANDSTRIRYFLYARKSSESEDRQVQSIDNQTRQLRELTQRLGIKVIQTFTESKSAKAPYVRPVFDEMMNRIENGEAEGILVWQFNRLSRNPVDTGHIIWLLQSGKIKSLQTFDRQYLPEDNALLLAIEGGVANQYIVDLKRNVKSGVDGKLEKGWAPNLAPIGYLNNKEDKTIVKDPERFQLVRKAWDLMLTGAYTPPQILDVMNDKWGFRTRKIRRCGGKPLSRSTLYQAFTNIFYAGIIPYNGKEYPGKHEPMITLDEYDRVQMLLGRKGKPRPKTHTFAFTGFIRCGECGCLYTAETKKKHLKCTGETKEYTYYHCTRKKTEIDCTQRSCIREDALEAMIVEEIEKYTILPEFRDWALEVLRESNDKEIEERTRIYETQQRTLNKTQHELDELTRMRYRGLIDDDGFLREKTTLQNQITQLRAHVQQTECRVDSWLELTEKVFDFAMYARRAFICGGLQTKKEILMALGSNPTIIDGKLSIQASPWLVPIAESYPSLEKQFTALEPAQVPENKERMGQLDVTWASGRWLTVVTTGSMWRRPAG